MVSRMVICLMLISSRGGQWILEQPATSLMHVHKSLANLMSNTEMFQVYMWMGAYGARTPETKMDRAVFGVNESSRPQIVREMAPHPVSGKRRVTGEKDELKQTQEYPVDYAAKVFVEWSAHRDSRRRQVQVLDESDSDGDSDLEFALEQWPEARMEQVSAFMGMEPNELPAGLGMR